jgi:hypothetical protein
MDGIASAANAMTIATTIPTMSNATSSIKMRNTASPVFPVGESARRHAECVTKLSAAALMILCFCLLWLFKI